MHQHTYTCHLTEKRKCKAIAICKHVCSGRVLEENVLGYIYPNQNKYKIAPLKYVPLKAVKPGDIQHS